MRHAKQKILLTAEQQQHREDFMNACAQAYETLMQEVFTDRNTENEITKVYRMSVMHGTVGFDAYQCNLEIVVDEHFFIDANTVHRLQTPAYDEKRPYYTEAPFTQKIPLKRTRY